MQSCKNEWEIHYYTPGGNNYFIRFFDQAGNIFFEHQKGNNQGESYFYFLVCAE